jgi:hypothetical protein
MFIEKQIVTSIKLLHISAPVLHRPDPKAMHYLLSDDGS